MRKLLQLLAFITVLPLFANAQTCPTMYSRNNGNNSPTGCPGAGGTTPQVSTTTGTPYSYSNCCSSLTKTGGFYMKWTNSVSPSYVPAIKDCYINGVAAATIFGPPSFFDSTTNTGKKAVSFCFYTVNLPSQAKFTVNFVNPVTNAAYASCNYTWNGSGDVAPNPQPTINVTPVGGTVCPGTSYTFSVSATTSPTTNVLTYQWKKNGTVISGARGTTYTLSNVARSDSGYYSCTILDSTAVTYSTTTAVQLNVLAGPTVTSASNNGPLCTGGTLNLTANSPSGVSTYAWTGPTTITNSSTANASVPSVTTGASGVYTLSLSDGTCSRTYTTTASIVTSPNLTNFTNPTVTAGCTNGTVVTLHSSTLASGTYTVTYSLSGANTSTGNTATATVTNPSGTFTIPASQVSSTGSTTVTVTGISVGAACSVPVSSANTATFTVGGAPASATATASQTSICANSATLNLTGSSTNATSWSWAGPNSYSSTSQNPSFTINSTAQGGVYTLTASSACGSVTATTPYVYYSSNGTGAPTFSGGASYVANVSPTTLCAGSNLTLNANAKNSPITYQWTGPGGFSQASTTGTVTFAATASNSGTYTVSAINGCGSGSTTATVTVNPLPSAVTATPSSTTPCVGSTLTLTGAATNGGTWSWSGPNGFTSSVQSPTLTTTASSGGVYTLSTVSSAGCGTTTATTATVTMIDKPSSVTATPSDNPICASLTLTLNGADASGMATSWSWAGPNSFSSALQSPTVSVTAASAGVYTASAINSCGTTTTTTTVVTVNPLPSSAVANISSASLCAGANLTLTGSATNATSYSWAGPNGYSSTDQNPTAFAVNSSSVGIYTITASNDCSYITATTSSVAVNSLPDISNFTSPSAAAACSGSGAVVTVNSTSLGAGTYTVTYSVSGANTVSAGTATLTMGASTGTFTTSSLGNAGSNTVTITAIQNASGCSIVVGSSNTASFSVINSPTSVGASASPNPLCASATLTLTGSATGATSWSWSGPNSFSATVQSPTLTATAAAAGIYTLSAINSCGTVTATTSAVTVNTTPTSVSANASASSLCSGSNLTLTSSATGANSYSWAGPGSYTATVQNPSAFAVTTSNAGVYTVTATNTCGSSTATTSAVTVNTTPTSVSANASASSLCSGSNLTLTSSATGANSYSWAGPGSYTATVQNPSAFAVTTSNAGVYTVTATNTCGSSTATTSAVTVNTTPTSVSANASASSLCSGSNLTLTSSATGANSYSWAGPGSYTATVQNPSAFAVTTSNAGIYTVTATNTCGSATATTSAVTVNTTPTSVSANASASSLCSGSNLTLTSSATGANSYSWAGPGSYTATVQNPSAFAVTTSNAGIYTVTAINTCGSSTATTSAVTVNTTPTSVSANASASSLCSGSNLTLTSSATGANSYSWAGPGSYTATVQNPSAFAVTTSNAGIYTVTATNSCGSSTATTSAVTVNTTPTSVSANASASSLCSGSNLTLTSSATGANSYSWAGPGSYTATVQNPSAFAVTTSNAGIYTVTATNSCGSSTATASAVAVTPLPDAGNISGAVAINVGATITLSSTGSGGVWSSSNTTVATVGSISGVVLGLLNGTSTISYSYTNTCGTDVATAIVTVNTLAPITGPTSVLVGNSITLADATTGGAWSSSNNAIASIGTNGVVAAGTTTTGVVTITYTVGGAYVTYEVTVNPIQPITGPSSVLVGNSITLADATTGGAWSSSNNTIASIGTNGLLTAGTTTTGVVTITYTVGGAYVTYDVTVNPIQPITGPASVLVGNSITLADVTTGGTWSSSNNTIASIGTNGLLTAGTSTTGVVTITYTVGGAYVTYNVTVNPIQPITGPTSVLVGNSITLADATTGGAWSSSNNAIASIGTNGVVAAGTTTTGVVTITYTVGGAYVTYDVTVNPIQPITGPTSVLVGNSITLADATTGGTWSSSNTSVATIGTNGLLTAGTTTTGVVTITYTVGGAYVTYNVTVNPIQPITGPTSVLVGNSITLADATTGGTWSSSNSSIATIGTNGLLTAGTSTTGVVTITYTVGGAYVTYNVTVNPIQPITGPTSVLVGNSITLADATTGGTWSSSNNSIASIGTNGLLTAGTSTTGVVTITYTVGGAYVTKDVTVNPIQPITGPASVLVGNSITLADATTGGTWSSSNTSVATIGTNGIVTAGTTTTGVVTITYTVGGAYVTYDVTVNPIQPITGPTSVLVGNSITLADATTGGAWSSSNNTIASIGTNGLLTAGTSTTGVVTITYTVGGAYVTYNVTINPIQPITGPTSVLVGNSITLANATTGGTWSSSNTSVATIGTNGIVTAGTTTPGVVTITYTVGGAYVTYEVTVNPIQPITGPTLVLVGNSITLADATTGGTWSSSNNAIATIGTNGLLNADTTTTGVVTITYTVGGAYVTYDVTVNPIQPITGPTSVLVGNSITLADATTGGVWSTSNSSIATIGTNGVVTAGTTTTGVVTITYTVGGAYVTKDVTVNPIQPITGPASVLVGNSITLADATTGGTWSSSNNSIATIGTNGLLTAGTSTTGVVTITYTVGGAYVTYDVTVNPIQPITGPTSVLVGNSITLADATAGGTWSSSNTIASIGTNGVVTAGTTTTGVVTITYTVGGAYVTYDVTVNPIQPITGPTSVLVGNSITLADATTGGVWSTSNSSIATIGTNGVVTAGTTTTGVVTITYTVGGAYVTKDVTVNPIQPITGPTSVLVGNSITLADATTGGTWSSSNNSIATIGSNGLLTAGTSTTGVVTITYTVGGAYVTYDVTVNPIQPITGPSSVLAGNSITLADATTGGTWSSSNNSIATIGTNGLLTAGTSTTGVVTITYTVGGAYVTYEVTVNPIQPITGPTSVLVGNSITLADATAGGAWSSSNNSIATIGTNGVVTAGTTTTGAVTITYTVGGAYVTYDVTVNPIQPITGPTSVLVGNSITLADATTGGTWSTSNSSIATIGTNGVVTAGTTTTGVVTITYTVGGAYVTYDVTVNPIQPITGPASVLVGNSITLADATTGGTWSTSNSSIATIGTNGLLTAGTTTTGVVTITYTVGGAYVTYDVTVNPIQPITGPTSVLVGNSITLADATTGGTWSSNNSIATIGSNGLLTAGTTTTGVVTITYTVGGAYVTYDVTVNSIQPITGPTSVLVGNSITLADATTGGTWSSSNNTIASIGTNGVVTAGTTTTGVVTITYTVGGAYVTYDVTVNPIQPITGPTSVLVGNSITLADATTGGTWSSSNNSIATIGTNGLLTAGTTTTGVVTITYTVGGAYVTYNVTVNPIQPITGPTSVIAGATITLADATSGGAWTTSGGIATISSGGVVTGVTPGTVTVTYTIGGGRVIYTITVNPLLPITGANSVCLGSMITLSDATPAGDWNTSDAAVATITNTGVVAGVAAGTATISYTVTGVTVTKTVTVNTVAAITGASDVCVSSTITLANATSGGTWSSAATVVATIGSSSGIVSGVASGATNITYTSAAGCRATTTITVNSLPSVAAITGTTSVCQGLTTTLNNSTIGGVWSSNNTPVATIGSTGVVTGVASGNATISYALTNGFGCTTTVTKAVTVNALPVVGAISGASTVCAGNVASLTNSTASGVWTSSDASVATVSSSTGVVSGVSNGTSTITYTVTSGAGCVTAVSKIMTVTSAPAITGSTALCTGQTATLSNSATDGTWSSSNTARVTIGSATGILMPLTPGLATITYTQPSGCYSTVAVSVNIAPAPIVGSANVCVGSTAVYSNTVGGGFWSASNPSVANVDPAGVVTSYAVGNSTISYSMYSGCYVTVAATVNPYPSAITGATMICTGNNITLSDATTGGTWSSNDITIATIGSADGIVSSVGVGTAIMTYTSDKGCAVTTSVNNPMNKIVGSKTMCMNLSQTLEMLTTGGTWTISDTAIASVSSTGYVTAKSTIGTATITYSLPSGCYRTLDIEVVTSPSAITGSATTCPGQTITLSASSTGGYWRGEAGTNKIDGPSGDGHVVGLVAGVATVTYALSPTCYVLHTITVNPNPASITGASQICQDNATLFADPTSGGTWLTSNSTIASVSPSTGLVTGVSGGTATISYMMAGTGCYKTRTITINSTPPAIDGNKYTCVGATTVLSDASTTPLSWSSSNTSVATVGVSGVVSGLTSGTTNITFTTGNLCYTTAVVTVQALPGAISGPSTICSGSTATMSSTDAGGTWSCNNTSVAVADVLYGTVTGVGSGMATITYTYGSLGCTRTKNITVNPVPAAITGTTSVCAGGTTTLSNGGTGGTWSSGDATIATVGATNRVVTGVAPGTVTITNTMSTGCTTSIVVTVMATPAVISGAASVSVGATTTYTNATSGGTWSISNPAIATIAPATGVVTGVIGGAVVITYTNGTGCYAVKSINVSAINPISGTMVICEGGATALTCGTSGGSWISTNAAVATIGSSTGIVSGLTAGTTTITYMLSTGVFRTVEVTINPAPSAITGSTAVCSGGTFTLSHAVPGGTWTSGNLAIVYVGSSSGVVTGVGVGGTTTVTYTTGVGCFTATSVTVNPNPPVISNNSAICEAQTRTLSCATTGGSWTVDNSAVATINATTGLVTAIASGVTPVTYTVPTGCYTTANFTVNAAPATTTGSAEVCVAQSTTLSNSSPGTWSNGNPVHGMGPSTTGVVTGVSVGTTVITYTSTNGCARYTIVTINPIPTTIWGDNTVCPGLTTTFTDATPGGTWSTSLSSAGIASIDAGGVVTAIAPGAATISYTIDHGCYLAKGVTVNTPSASITGTNTVCPGGTTTLSCLSPGMTWTSSTPSVATIAANGVVTGIAPGTTTIVYTLGTGCNATRIVTVNAVPGTIGGVLKACPGTTTTLTNSVSGGAWTSANTAIATIDPSTGIASGVAAGVTSITYTAGVGCYRTAVLTVNANPNPITGNRTVCIGTSVTLASGSGGTWTSSDPATATAVLSGGYVTGVASGTSNISFTITSSGCYAIAVVTVIPVPSASTGINSMCAGLSTTLTNSTPGGTWSSANTAAATVGSATGVVTGVGAGTVNISYAINSTCRTITSFTVKALPGVITGTPSVCMPSLTTLGSATSGGTWSSSDVSVATIGSGLAASSGVVTGIAAGTTNVTYTVTSTGCSRSQTVTVNAGPNPGVISTSSGSTTLRLTSAPTVTLSTSGTPSGTWSSSNTAIATVNATTGLVTAVATGNVTITYTVTLGCTNTGTKFLTVATGKDGNNTVAGSDVPGISLYPNPTNGSFSLVSEEAGTLHLFSIDGKEITNYSISVGTNPLSLPQQLASGVYMCRFIGASGNTTMVRLVYEP